MNCKPDSPTGEFGCKTCEKRPGNCTSCRKGAVLNTNAQGQGNCLTKCLKINQVAIEGVCKTCEEPCKTCAGSTKSCTSCLNNYMLFKNTKCMQYCPTKYSPNKEQRKLPKYAKETICKFEGLVCPDKFEINKTQDGCVPKAFDCPPGY